MLLIHYAYLKSETTDSCSNPYPLHPQEKKVAHICEPTTTKDSSKELWQNAFSATFENILERWASIV